ncbi:hypothetical protein [Streptomyces olivaceiscleroticus]|uniref:Uncharacterized protein n=1 Tax=Streptomyces olivaceiscleroticus TaxID=68245 RepID=A0ABN0ZJH2_9ACTN
MIHPGKPRTEIPHSRSRSVVGDRRCPAAVPKDPTPCAGPHDAATLVDRLGGEVVGCVTHLARHLAGADGTRVHPFTPPSRALDIYSRARELPPAAWKVGK